MSEKEELFIRKTNFRQLCYYFYNKFKNIYSTISSNPTVLKVLNIFFDKWLLTVSMFLMLGVSFFDCINNCIYKEEVYLYFLGLFLTSFSISEICRLFSLYKKRVLFFAVLYFLITKTYINIDASVIDAYFILSLGICLLSIKIILYDTRLFSIPIFCLFAQSLYFSFCFLFIPLIFAFFLSEHIKNRCTDRKKHMILVVSLCISQIIGICIHRFLFSNIKRLSDQTLFLGNRYMELNVCSVCFIVYIMCYIVYRIYKTTDRNARNAIALSYMIPIGVYVPVFLFVSKNILYYDMFLLMLIGNMLIQDEYHMKKHVDFVKTKVFPFLKSKFFFLMLILISVAKVLYVFGKTEICKSLFTISMYFIDYQTFGFIQRGFIGTIYHFILGYSMPVEKVMSLAINMYFLIGLCIIILLAALIINLKEGTNRNLVVYFLFLYLFSPAFMSYFNEEIIAKYDLYLLFFSLLSIWILIKNKYVYLIPVLCSICMLTHQVYLFTFFPLLFIFMLYRSVINNEGYFARNFIVLISSVLIVCGLFLYLQFFSFSHANLSVEEAEMVLNVRSGGYFEDTIELVEHVILSDVKHHLSVYQNQIAKSQIRGTLKYIFCMLPLVILYFYAFLISAKREKNKIKKASFYIMPFSILAFLPCYMLEIDYGRWNAHLLMHFVLSLLFLTIIQKDHKQKWYSNLKNLHLLVWCIIIIYMFLRLPSSFGVFL